MRSRQLATRRQFVLAGALGLVLALLTSLLTFFLAPALPGLAFLAQPPLDSTLPAMLFLLAIGFLAVAELPVVLFALLRMARRGLPAITLNGTHLAYTFFPAVYGAMGTLLTGERWWLAVMALLAFMRLFTSAFLISDPREMAARHAAKAAGVGTPAPSVSGDFLAAMRGFILDMDGVLYRGNTPREGAIAFVEYLNAQGIPYICLTNNASRTSAMYQEKLDRLGIPIDSAHVLGAAQATAEWLRDQLAPGARVLPIGEDGLREELLRAGFTLVEQPPADAVVVGIDFGLSYERLKQATLALRSRARFIGTNPDATFPSEEGLVPGNGAALAYLETASGVTPEIIGKPATAIMEVARAHLGLPPGEVAMVGDRLNTDIQGGHNAGLRTILLRGGVTSTEELAASPLQPDLVVDDLADLLTRYQAAQAKRANSTPSR